MNRYYGVFVGRISLVSRPFAGVYGDGQVSAVPRQAAVHAVLAKDRSWPTVLIHRSRPKTAVEDFNGSSTAPSLNRCSRPVRSVDSRSLRSHIDISAANLVKQFGVGQDSASNSTCYENPAV